MGLLHVALLLLGKGWNLQVHPAAAAGAELLLLLWCLQLG
jgi:hypothetical protein